MTTKHKAEVLADWVKDTEFYDNPNPEINDRMDEVEPLLRTIPAMEAEIEALRAEDYLGRGQYQTATMYLNRIGVPKDNDGVELSLLGRFNLFVKSGLSQQQAEIESLKSGGEPVAWMQTWRNQRNEIAMGLNFDRIGKSDIALYTRPAKTLTDEETLKTVRSYLPSGVEAACAKHLGWSHEYMLGYNDALCEVRVRLATLKKDGDVAVYTHPAKTTDRIAELEKENADLIHDIGQFVKIANYEANIAVEKEQRVAELEKEKARAYNNGFEDGQKALTKTPVLALPSKEEIESYQVPNHACLYSLVLDALSESATPHTKALAIAKVHEFIKRPKKTLTDDEINAVWHKDLWKSKTPHLDFARALLKKAGEK